MAAGEIPKLTNFLKKTTVTKDDRRAYHDRGWLIGNLISFIPEVDVVLLRIPYVSCFSFCFFAVLADGAHRIYS
jgi:hypothetical protein